MAAGCPTSLYGPVDWYGGQTADAIQSWPHRPRPYGYGAPEKEFNTSNFAGAGAKVRCHAGQAHDGPSRPAGQSKRVSSYYQKTGGLDHRTEPEFRTTKGYSTLTEANTEPLYARPTFQTTAPLVLTRTARENSGLPAPTVPTIRPADLPPLSTPRMAPDTARSRGSRGSRGSRQSGYSARSQSQRSEALSDTSKNMAWYNSRSPRQPWDFDIRPMYETTAREYGKNWDAALDPAAGLTWSGFNEPTILIKTLTARDQTMRRD